MSNEDYYVQEAFNAVADVMDRLLPEVPEDVRHDVAYEIAAPLDTSMMLRGGYRKGSY